MAIESRFLETLFKNLGTASQQYAAMGERYNRGERAFARQKELGDIAAERRRKEKLDDRDWQMTVLEQQRELQKQDRERSEAKAREKWLRETEAQAYQNQLEAERDLIKRQRKQVEKGQEDANDFDYRYNQFLRGRYQPATDEERQAFDKKMGSSSGASAGPTTSELWKMWQKMDMDEKSAYRDNRGNPMFYLFADRAIRDYQMAQGLGFGMPPEQDRERSEAKAREEWLRETEAMAHQMQLEAERDLIKRQRKQVEISGASAGRGGGMAPGEQQPSLSTGNQAIDWYNNQVAPAQPSFNPADTMPAVDPNIQRNQPMSRIRSQSLPQQPGGEMGLANEMMTSRGQAVPPQAGGEAIDITPAVDPGSLLDPEMNEAAAQADQLLSKWEADPNSLTDEEADFLRQFIKQTGPTAIDE